MNSKVKFWTILLNPVFLGLYFIGMRQLYDLCLFGGVRRKLPLIAACGFAGVLWVVVWTIIWFLRKKKEQKKAPGKRTVFIFLLCAEVLIAAAVTGYYGVGIVQSAEKYTGKLSWKLDEWKNSKKISLKHDNLFEDGIEGIFTDIEEKIDLPEDLYTSNQFSVVFDADGTISEIYSLMYGRDEKGKSHTYLLDYQRNQSDKMTVWIDDGGGDYGEEKKLEPMRELFPMMEIDSILELWEESYAAQSFRILYMGYRSFAESTGLVALNYDGSTANAQSCVNDKGEYEGYEISLFVPNREEILPIRFMNNWDKLEIREEEPEISYEIGVSVKEQSDGNVYFFINEQKGWRLVVKDAALGSRWYGLEVTEDGGNTWQNLNGDPFAGSAGVAEGIQFFDESFGFLLMGGASESHAELYVTRDGGVSLEEVKLPKEKITDDIADLDEYDYTTMPVKEGETLKAELRLEKYDCGRALFESYDDGITWNYVGFSED